jgi:hypothetical protein
VSRPALARVLGIGLGLLASPLGAGAQDLDAGKTPAQLFSAHCAACHRSPQGLAKQTFTLGSFLRQHYTTSSATASALAAYVAAAGPAPEPRRGQQGRRETARTPVVNGGDPRILREPGAAQPSAAQPAPEPPKPRVPRDPRLAVAVSSDPQPFLILRDPIPVPPDPTPRRALAAVPPASPDSRPSLPATPASPDATVAVPAGPGAGGQATATPTQDSERATTTTAGLAAEGSPDARNAASPDQPTFSAPLP